MAASRDQSTRPRHTLTFRSARPPTTLSFHPTPTPLPGSPSSLVLGLPAGYRGGGVAEKCVEMGPDVYPPPPAVCTLDRSRPLPRLPLRGSCLLCKFTNRGGAQVCAACENPRQFAPSSTTASAAEARAAIEAQTYALKGVPWCCQTGGGGALEECGGRKVGACGPRASPFHRGV